MKIKLICIGKMANPHLKALAEEYRERMRRLCDLDVVELKDASARDGAARLEAEAARIREASEGAVAAGECALLDEGGETMDSRGFAKWLEKLELASAKRLVLVIGSSHGLEDALKADVPRKVSLSRMTLTHEWARALLLEQLYRAQCIRRNIPYHH